MDRITQSEEAIMNLLWKHGSLSIMQLVQELEESKHWSKQTIVSFLRRMEEKGTVKYEQKGRTKYYYATIDKDDVVQKETKGILNRFFGGKWGTMVSYMAKETQLSDEDINELWDVLQELREAKDGKCD